MLQCLKREPGFYRYLWGLTGPIALQNLITFTLGLMDTLMVSWLGNTQMAAVTTANVPVFLLISIVFGVQSGLSILVSQYWGKRDMEHISRAIGVAAMLGTGLTVVLAAVLYAAVFGLTDTLVSWFNSENSVQMAQYAHTGMRMYFVGYFFAGFNIMAAGYLSAVNRPAEASITSICRGMVAIVACSLVLSAVFGMPGVWAAFPASELLTVLLTLFLLRRKESGKA
jgi:Na+-driven multidrug efflux pump